MIVDASVVIDAVADSGPRGVVAREFLAAHPGAEPLVAPGHFAIEVLSGLLAAAGRPGHPLQLSEVRAALADAQALAVAIEATPWEDVSRAWTLSEGSLRYADALYIAAAERHASTLLTADARIARSGAPFTCTVVTVRPAPPQA